MLALAITAATSQTAGAEVTHRIREVYPRAVQLRWDAWLGRAERASLRGSRPFLVVVERALRWYPGQLVRVAFNGGTPELHARIAEATSEWTSHANLRLDFGHDRQTGRYRSWSSDDHDYRAEIRIAFEHSGYWSALGVASVNPAVYASGEPSMNLEGFDGDLPGDWRATVLHEFGHALGAKHEHQSPREGCDFRWENDPGYVYTVDAEDRYIADPAERYPGIYTVYGGKPNCWSRPTVDYAFRRLEDGDAYEATGFDPLSIMKYHFEAWELTQGEQSPCYTATPNEVLSSLDGQGIAQMYPKDEDATLVVARRELAETLRELSGSPELTTVDRAFLRRRLEQLLAP